MTKQMLDGVKVIDLSRNLAAPFCTMILADLGAEIIKIEMPGEGDPTRAYAPIIKGKGGYFLSVNRGKKSITLDLKQQEGKDILTKLLKDADVLVDNYRPGVLERLGFTDEVIKGINPGLVHASITGFGHTGPYKYRAAYDLIVQGMGGLMSITGQDRGEPTRVGVSIGDLAAGLFAVIGIVGALYGHEKTGGGDRLDIAMLDCQIALLENSIIRYTANQEIPGPVGNRHPSITPFEMFPTSDGNIIVCVGNQQNWEVLCDVLVDGRLREKGKFDTNDLRTEKHDELYGIIADILKKNTTDEWDKIFCDAGIACGTVNNVRDVVNNEQVKARNMIVSTEYPDIGTVRAPGSPIKSRGYSIDTSRISPSLGSHNEAVYSSLGISETKMNELREKKII